LIVSLRNRIAHDYRGIDPFVSFDIIQNYFPALKEVLIEMLDQIEQRPIQRILSQPAQNQRRIILKE